MDGASKLRIYWSIVLPLSKPIFATVAILQFLARWNDYLWPVIAVQGETWDQADEEGLAFTRELGNEIIELAPEQNALWVEAAQPVLNEYIEGMKEKNLPGEQAVAELQGIIQQCGK